ATATLQLNPLQKGTATLTVKVKDAGDGNNSKSVAFNAVVNNTLNKAPTIAAVKDLEVYQDAGPSSLSLTGLGDGDGNKGNQVLTLAATSSNPAAVKNVSVAYVPYANTATLNYEPVAGALGASTLTVTVTDNGGNGNNNGNQTTTLSFKMDVVKRPLTGYTAAMQKSVEGFGASPTYTVTEEVIDGIKTLIFDCKDKFYWDGVSMNLPEELDLSQHPYLTMEVFPVDQSTIHWIWFWDVTGVRNTLNNREGDHIQRPVAGKWNKLVFDFSRPNDWVNNDTGQPINNKRINRILFDMHNADFNWPPPPNYTGKFMVRNIRIGSQADFTPTYTATINAVANQVAFPNLTSQAIGLSGLSNGKGNAAGVTVSVASSNPAVVPGVEVGGVDADGNARLTYSTGGGLGKSTITLTAAADGSVSKSVSFDIQVLSGSGDDAATVGINLSQKYQKMYGFGTFSNSSQYSDMYTRLMGGTAMRVGLIGNQLEEVNDNDDPNVLNMDALNYAAFDWNYYRDLKERGVQSFILTSWSPPAWMKTSLTIDYKEAGYTKDTDGTTNRLDYAMYDEFAESMVAVVKAFKQRAGIDLLGIGVQNEPAFHEPYPSAILGFDKFALLLKVVGKRFEKEGIKTNLFMAEQVSGSLDGALNFYEDNHNYLKAVKADPESNKYTDIFAIHGYGSDGITPGQPRYDAWESYRDSAAAGPYPKGMWMTETYKEYNTWQDALDISGAIYGALQYGNVSLWTQWGFEGQMSKKGAPTPMLYAMSNFAKFIRPGDVRVGSASNNPDIMATSFLDEATGRLSVVIVNKGATPVSMKLDGAGLPTAWKMFVTAENRNLEAVNSAANGVFLLPARSVTTLEGTGTLQMARVADVAVAADGRTHSVLVKGIGSATGNLDGLQLAVRNSNETIVPNITASQIDANGTAVLTFVSDKFVGTSTITLLLTDAAGNKVAQDFRIKTVGGGAEAQGNSLQVFPNPSRGTFSLGMEATGPVQITDLTGRVLHTTYLRGGNRTISVPGLRKGAYVLVVQTPEGKRTARILVE
ncbi:MAG: T9SS type A sorting domain-containing protein, partial [Cytophagales bacterium]|nr:T9SS type A sorting domain-containing protein [Cytophagales bacterium]